MDLRSAAYCIVRARVANKTGYSAVKVNLIAFSTFIVFTLAHTDNFILVGMNRYTCVCLKPVIKGSVIESPFQAKCCGLYQRFLLELILKM